MTELPDIDQRFRVLTDLDSTLLVEAAAGTGKTALIAARVTMLLLRGTSPRAIAAITFTELAASELAARVDSFVKSLLAGVVPPPLIPALPNGLSEAQRSALSSAAAQMGELTTATIHAFCQALITAYAIEAGVDPGSRILDADQAEAVIDSVFEHWLRRRLSGPEVDDDATAVLCRVDPRGVVSTLKKLAVKRIQYRDARPPRADLSSRLDLALSESVSELETWLATLPPNQKAADLLKRLRALVQHFEGKAHERTDFATLWRVAHPPEVAKLFAWNSKELQFPERLGAAWVRKAGKQVAAQLESEAMDRFDRIAGIYRSLLGQVCTAVIERLSKDLDEVVLEYQEFKRNAALLDFDDLLQCARALIGKDEAVRNAVGARYRHILVDEFQDTDPTQCEILFRIAADAKASMWQECRVRAGSLFLVGDPKQAIYGFRGADIACYLQAREAITHAWPDSIVRITANFRSRPAILSHVNRCFSEPFSGIGQPSYVPLAPTLCEAADSLPSVLRLAVEVEENANAGSMRDMEARQVADACRRLVGNVLIEVKDGVKRPLRYGDIALLTAQRTELWRYERALEARGVPVASQAGKNLFRRQEVQDLLAMARTIADPLDGVAFGAFMRGPLVGMTEQELLDIAAALPQPAASETAPRSPRLSASTRSSDIAHPEARHVISILHELRRRSRQTTPTVLLAEAIERLHVRAILVAREGPERSTRTLANIEAFIQLARTYGVSGLRRFVRDVTRDWSERASRGEGRVDGDGDAVELITMHSAKGLEWPVVIPINGVTSYQRRDPFVHRISDNTLHWLVGDVVPPSLREALDTQEESEARERVRCLYVALTRARDILILPDLDQPAPPKSWTRVVDVLLQDLPALKVAGLAAVASAGELDGANGQDAASFRAEQERVVAMSSSLEWVRPSDHDADRLAIIDTVEAASGGVVQAQVEPVGAGRFRGLILHKLMEEVLTGELIDDEGTMVRRAKELSLQLMGALGQGSSLPDPQESAETIMRTIRLPDVATLRHRLVPELSVYGLMPDAPVKALAGRVDAMAMSIDGSTVDVVLDWKSDVEPSEHDVQVHATQLLDYMRTVQALRGALIYMTTGRVLWTHLEN
jgi:CRISPR-associated exonuclease Cas4